MASGAIGYSMPEGLPRMDGRLGVAGGRHLVCRRATAAHAQADLRFSGSTVTLAPARIVNSAAASNRPGR